MQKTSKRLATGCKAVAGAGGATLGMASPAETESLRAAAVTDGGIVSSPAGAVVSAALGAVSALVASVGFAATGGEAGRGLTEGVGLDATPFAGRVAETGREGGKGSGCTVAGSAEGAGKADLLSALAAAVGS